MLWTPLLCPTRPACRIECGPGGQRVSDFIRFERVCTFHQPLLTGGFTELDLFKLLRATMTVKEKARGAFKEFVGRTEDDPDYSVRIDPNGDIVIVTGESTAIKTNFNNLLTTRLAERDAELIPVAPGTIKVE